MTRERSLRDRLQPRPSVPCGPESPRKAVEEMAVLAGDKIKDLNTVFTREKQMAVTFMKG